jgi:hypothetical protein
MDRSMLWLQKYDKKVDVVAQNKKATQWIKKSPSME